MSAENFSKIADDDEGGLALSLGIKGNVVIMEFGKHIRWIGFEAEELRQIIGKLQEMLSKLETTIQ